jgi:16S rRNA (cytosine967-C5)-methyltransferase
MVNAILRRVSELRGERVDAPGDPTARDLLPRSDGSAWQLTEPAFDESPARRLAQQTSHPDALIAEWSAEFGFEEASRLARHDLVQPPVIVAGLDGAGDVDPTLGLRPHREGGFHLLTGGRAALEALLARHPAARVQDPAAADAIRATAGSSPALIVDACAGRGTKSRQLAALHPRAEVIATDVHAARRAELRAAVADTPSIAVVEPDELSAFRGRTALLVLDVPCTNTGVLARRLEARYRYGRENLASLVKLQRQIVADTLPLLEESGRLLYSTCSLERRENEQQVEHLTRVLPLRTLDEGRRMPSGLPGDDPSIYADGSYWALLERIA